MGLEEWWDVGDEVTVTWEDCRRWHMQYLQTSVDWSLAKVSDGPELIPHYLSFVVLLRCFFVSFCWTSFEIFSQLVLKLSKPKITNVTTFKISLALRFLFNNWKAFGVLPLRETDEKRGESDHPPILPLRLMYTAQVAFIGFTKGLMTGIMRVMWH